MIANLLAAALFLLPPSAEANGLAGVLVQPAPLAAPSAGARQGEEEEKPDKRPEVKDLLDQLKEHVSKRGKEDDEAIQVIDKLVQEFPESGPKDRKAIVDGLDKCFKVKRKDLEDDKPDNRMFIASAVALGEMGPESAEVLAKLVDHKDHRDDLDLQRRIILSLGKTESEKHVEVLLSLLKHHEPRMQAVGAEALANFYDHDLKLRKTIFEEILKIMMGVRAKVDTDPNDTISQDQWDVIGGPMISALQKISGHDERDPQAWQSWWNNNKKEDWPLDHP